MDKRRSIRILISSFAAAVIALGGFAAGYAKTQENSQIQIPLRSPAFLGKMPTYNHYVIARDMAPELKISDQELARLEIACMPLFAPFEKTQKSSWEEELDAAELAEEGKLLNSTGRYGVGGIVELRESEARESKYNQAEAAFALNLSNIIGRERTEKVIEISIVRRRETTNNALFLALDPANGDAVGLSRAQKNQLVLLEAYFASVLQSGSSMADRQFRLEDELPNAGKNRAILAAAKDHDFYSYYERVMLVLSPLQKMRLKALVCDHLYVRP